MNYLASPPLVVAYAIAGTIDIDLTRDPIGHDPAGNAVYLRDIWPTNKEIGDMIAATVGPELFAQNYADVFKGDSRWKDIQSPDTLAYQWDEMGRENVWTPGTNAHPRSRALLATN